VYAGGRPEQILAPALRDWTEPGPLPAPDVLTAGVSPVPELCPRFLFAPFAPFALAAAFAVAAGAGAGAFTPAKLVPRISVTGPAVPACQAGSASVFCPAGNDVSAVISV
jgi:hypothetical protein